LRGQYMKTYGQDITLKYFTLCLSIRNSRGEPSGLAFVRVK